MSTWTSTDTSGRQSHYQAAGIERLRVVESTGELGYIETAARPSQSLPGQSLCRRGHRSPCTTFWLVSPSEWISCPHTCCDVVILSRRLCANFIELGLDPLVSINGSTTHPESPLPLRPQLAPGGVSAWRAQFDPETTLVPELFKACLACPVPTRSLLSITGADQHREPGA